MRWLPLTRLLLLTTLGCKADPDSRVDDDSVASTDTASTPELISPDTNGDGRVDILVLGTTESVDGGAAFGPFGVAEHLALILVGHADLDATVDVVPRDLYTSEPVTFGLGGRGDEYTVDHHRHSLLQYHHWPDDMEARHADLEGLGDRDWDHVVLLPDPAIVVTTPGVHALGVHRAAALVARGGATPHLLMGWRTDQTAATTETIAAVSRTIASGSDAGLTLVPAGLAWAALPDELRDASSVHPSPAGAYLAAAAVYTRITGTSAATSSYTVDDALAAAAMEATEAYDADNASVTAPVSPHSACDIADEVISWNHTGSSSENGILDALRQVFDLAPETLVQGVEPPITFNYGRANSNFEPDKRYQVDPERFRFSFGFPMQDHGNHGDLSMRYGLDRRDAGVLNDTDLGVARFMVTEGELPTARAVPIRTLFAELWALDPTRSAYRDAWHMHRDLDRATAGYMYTLLTGSCVLGPEPDDPASAAWTTWRAHKVGCDTAWTMSTLEAASPF